VGMGVGVGVGVGVGGCGCLCVCVCNILHEAWLGLKPLWAVLPFVFLPSLVSFLV